MTSAMIIKTIVLILKIIKNYNKTLNNTSKNEYNNNKNNNEYDNNKKQ